MGGRNWTFRLLLCMLLVACGQCWVDLHSTEEQERCNLASVPEEQRCRFVKEHADWCQADDGLFNYLQFHYCTYAWRGWSYVSGTLMAMWLTILLWTTVIVAGSFFCPAVELMAEYLQLPPTLAGATLLAFGNGANDVFTQLAAVKQMDKDSLPTAITESLGGGMIVSNVVLGAVVLLSARQPVDVERRAFLRDTLFYAGAVAMLFVFMLDGRVTVVEAVAMGCYYVLYVVVSFLTSRGMQAVQVDHTHDDDEFEDALEEFYETFVSSPMLGRRRSSQLLEEGYLPAEEVDMKERLLMAASGELDDAGAAAGPAPVRAGSLTQPLLRVRVTVPAPEGAGAEAAATATPASAQQRDAEAGLASPHRRKRFRRNAWQKAALLVEAPLTAVIRLTMPQVDPRVRYPLPYAVALPFLAPAFLLASNRYTLADLQPAVLLYGGLCSAFSAGTIWSVYPPRGNSSGPFQGIFTITAFVMSMQWLNVACNELVAVCAAAGHILGVRRPLIAATVLAWGNSLNDLVANATIAAAGFPTMALTACFASPLFNLLMGMSISLSYRTITSGTITNLQMTNAMLLFFSFHLALLLRYILYIPTLGRWQLTRASAVVGLLLYSTFLCLYVPTSMGIIFQRPWWPQPQR